MLLNSHSPFTIYHSRLHKRLRLQVFAVRADGDRAALARGDDLRARRAPAREDFRVRVAVGRVLADGDDGERRARGGDEGVGRRSASSFIGETFAHYTCVCMTY